MTISTTTTTMSTNDEREARPSPALAAYLYANGLSIYELLENCPALDIDDLSASLRLARGIAAECDLDAE